MQRARLNGNVTSAMGPFNEFLNVNRDGTPVKTTEYENGQVKKVAPKTPSAKPKGGGVPGGR